MALNFPDTPTVGQLFPSPSLAGIPTWKWDGNEWVPASTGGTATFQQFEYIATAGQLTFSGADINGNTLAYSGGFLEVYVNGSKLNKADFAATTGTSVVLQGPGVVAKVGDQVTILVFGTVLIAYTISSVKKQIFTASGTYTPSLGMVYCIIEAVGGGGAGGGVAAGTTTGTSYGSGGGGAGGYSRTLATAATIGASQPVTIGAGGTPGAAGANNGGNGGDTSFGTPGTICWARGGTGGGFAAATGFGAGGPGGIPGSGDITAAGDSGTYGGWNSTRATVSVLAQPGNGGSSFFGGGATGTGIAGGNANNGTNARNYGSGGSGAWCDSVANANAVGGSGSAGIVIVTEFCSQ